MEILSRPKLPNPTVKARKWEDGLPRLAHGARHLPKLSLAVYVSFLPSFMSSNFGAQNVFLQVLPHSETRPTFLLQVLARVRNSRGHRGRAFTQAPAVPGPTVTALPQVLAGFSTRRNRFPGRNRFPPSTGSSEMQSWPCPQCVTPVRRRHGGIAFTQVRAFSEPTVLHPEPRRKCFAPSTNGIQKQSTARGQCFAPSTGGIQNQSTAWRNRFPQVLAALGPTAIAFSSSTGTELRTIQTNHGSGRAGVRGGRFRDAGLRGALRGNMVFAKGSKLGRSHSEACSFWKPCGMPDCPERKVGRLGFRTKRAGTHFPTFRL